MREYAFSAPAPLGFGTRAQLRSFAFAELLLLGALRRIGFARSRHLLRIFDDFFERTGTVVRT